jgi:CubicO group peptidase (beta-lactamase class C family)
MKERNLVRATNYIKSWLQFQYDRDNLPGFVVAIAHDGKVILSEAYGYANLERQEKMQSDHIFRIASHSKTFTATAIMQLQEKGKLKIDDPAVDHLPWLKKHKGERFGNVTIRQLSSHGAGVIRDGARNDFWSVDYPFPSEEQFKEEILTSDLVIDNNTKLKYSNYGYTLLGLIVASASGQPYNDYVIENIVKPLGLKNTGPEFTPSIKKKIVTGYTREDFAKKRLPIVNIDTRAMSPATGFYSTAEDLCKYFTAQMVGSGKLLSDESKREMQKAAWEAENTRDKEEYGLGFEIEHVNNQPYFGHGGGFPGQLTSSKFNSKNRLVIEVLTNSYGSGPGGSNKSIIKILDYFQEVSESKFREFEGRYRSIWWTVDVIASGNKLILAHTEAWEPLDNPTELEHHKDNTFKVTKTDSFGSFGEGVEFKKNKSGDVDRMIFAGGEMLIEKLYIEKYAKKKTVG